MLEHTQEKRQDRGGDSDWVEGGQGQDKGRVEAGEDASLRQDRITVEVG
jgi:hypothetical protein